MLFCSLGVRSGQKGKPMVPLEYILPEIQAATADKYNSSLTSATATTCGLQGSNDYWYRTFLKHDIADILGKKVISASLNVYAISHGDAAASGTTNISKVEAAWDENTLCWDTQPTFVGLYLPEQVFPPAVATWAEWDITKLVSEWANQVVPNHGLYIRNNNEGAYRYNWMIANRRRDIGNLATYIKVIVDGPQDTASVYQQWADGLPDSPLVRMTYPYQCIRKTNAVQYLILSTKAMYHQGGYMYPRGSGIEYRLSADTLSWDSPTGFSINSFLISDIIQANSDIFTDDTCIYVAKPKTI